MATTEMNQTHHIKVEISPVLDESISKPGFLGQLSKGKLLLNINFHNIEDAFVELIRNRLNNNDLPSALIVADAKTPSINSVDSIDTLTCRCRKLEALLATESSKLSDEMACYGSSKQETIISHARLKYELEKAKLKLNELNLAER